MNQELKEAELARLLPVDLPEADMTSTRTEWSISHMERHIAKLTALSTGISLVAGTFAFAAVGGLSMLGLGAVKSVHESLAGPALTQDTAVTTPATGAAAAPALTNAPIVIPVGQPSTSTGSRAASAAIVIAVPQPADGPAANQPATPASPANAAPSGVLPVNTPAPTPPPTTAAPATTAPPVKTVPPTVATVPPTTATTAPKAPATTLPPGVPSDWPAGKPIPPMPAHCSQPQLELNGVWNCQD